MLSGSVQGVGFEVFVLSFNSSLSLVKYFGSSDVHFMIVTGGFPFEESDGLMRLSYCKFPFRDAGAINLSS